MVGKDGRERGKSKSCPKVLGVCEHNSGGEPHGKQQILKNKICNKRNNLVDISYCKIALYKKDFPLFFFSFPSLGSLVRTTSFLHLCHGMEVLQAIKVPPMFFCYNSLTSIKEPQCTPSNLSHRDLKARV